LWTQGAFVEAIAAAAGALKEDVSIKSVKEVLGRRGEHVRRAGTSATSLQVSVEVKTNNTAAVMLVSMKQRIVVLFTCIIESFHVV